LQIHGTEDTDVPYAASARVAALLSKHAVEHQLHTIDGAEHGLGDAEVPGRVVPDLAIQVERAYSAALAFMQEKWSGSVGTSSRL
jgi:dipeptidyl aminopeptidase/acylaminoacyl peptidase